MGERMGAPRSELEPGSITAADAAPTREAAGTRRVRSVLAGLRIAAPCSERWDAMHGDDRVRRCDACQLNVYDLSEMTREEAEALIREKEGRLCARYFERADGTILLKDCAIGVRRRRRRYVIAAGLAAAATSSLLPRLREAMTIQEVTSRSDLVDGGYTAGLVSREVTTPWIDVTSLLRGPPRGDGKGEPK